MKKIWRVVLATILAIVGVFAVSQSAQAYTYDCFPGGCSGVYWSTDTHAYPHGAGAGIDASPYGYSQITWDSGNNQFKVQTNLQDLAADGRGPILQMQVNGGVDGDTIYTLHYTGGVGSANMTSAWHPYAIGVGSDGVSLRMCNGYGTDGVADYCGSWHGPFHP